MHAIHADRLSGEWIINAFTKLEDERLQWHRQNAEMLTGQAPTGQFSSHVATSIHRSVHGSPAHMKTKVFVSLID